MSTTDRVLDVSNRGSELPLSPIRKLKKYADQAIENGKKIFHLNIGQPDIETPLTMLKVLKKFDEKVVTYGPSRGLAEYLDGLQKYYKSHNIDLVNENIIVTTGGSEAIIMAFLVCLDQGDEILIPEPFYANYNGFAAATGVNIVPISTYLEQDWQLPSVDEIEKMITKKTRAIMVCNPNNPTGKVYGRDELEKIVLLAKKHNLFLFGDEVYREFIYNDEGHTSLLHFKDVEDNVVVMDSISKRYSSCGARVGAFVSKNVKVVNAALAFAQARLCPPTIAQLMAIPSTELSHEYFKSVVGEYKKRRDVILSSLQDMEGVKFKTPEGAFYITVKLPVPNAEEFVVWLLTSFEVNNETIMLAPADGFYKTSGMGKDEVRIAFVLNEEKTVRAMNILREGLKQYLSEKK